MKRLIGVFLLASASFAMAQPTPEITIEEWLTKCEDLSDRAHTIMTARQMGVPRDVVSVEALEGIPAGYVQSVESMLTQAYQIVAMQESFEAKVGTALEFADIWFASCENLYPHK